MFCSSVFWLLLPCGVALNKPFYSFVKCLLFFNSRVKNETKIWLFLFVFHPGWIRIIWKSVNNWRGWKQQTCKYFPHISPMGHFWTPSSPPEHLPPGSGPSTQVIGAPGVWEQAGGRKPGRPFWAAAVTDMFILRTGTTEGVKHNGVFRSVLETCSITLKETVGEPADCLALLGFQHSKARSLFPPQTRKARSKRLKVADEWIGLSWVRTRQFLCVVYLFGAWNPDHESIIYSNVKRRNHDGDGTEYVWKSKTEFTVFIKWMNKVVNYWENCYHHKLSMQMYLNTIL